MIYLFMGIVATFAGGVILLKLETWNDFVAAIAFIMLGAAGAGFIVYGYLGFEYAAAGYKAEIINKEYGTSYTPKEVFYAHDVIDTIREIRRQRVELNGNLVRSEHEI